MGEYCVYCGGTGVKLVEKYDSKNKSNYKHCLACGGAGMINIPPGIKNAEYDNKDSEPIVDISEYDIEYDIGIIKSISAKDINVVCKKSKKDNKLYVIFVEIVSEGKLRPYTPEYFLDVYIMNAIEQVRKIKKTSEQVTFVYSLKSQVIDFIMTVNYHMLPYKDKMIRQYNFDESLKYVDSMIEYGNACLIADKHEIEVQKLHKENKFFTAPLIIALLALLISLIPYIDKWFFTDDNKPYRVILEQQTMPKPNSHAELDSASRDTSTIKARSGNK